MQNTEYMVQGTDVTPRDGRVAGDFHELNVWQRTKDFTVFLYRLVSKIAEGDELGSSRQAIELFNSSKGSAARLITQIAIAYEIGYLTDHCFDQIREECQAISNMLAKLIHIRVRAAH
ncbi:MAG: four helix bundle protein [Deltaproteobacteria bacterium]|nr:four helix bundle protein [Deltaproteobacteria bacterium]